MVTDPDLRSTLAVVRSLGAAGCEVYTAGDGLAARSRFARTVPDFPDPQSNPSGWRERLIHAVDEYGLQTVFPCGEFSCLQVLAVRDHIQSVRLTVPDTDRFDQACDKIALADVARRAGIPVPPQLHVEAGDDTPRGFEQWGSPVVLRPRRSWAPFQNSWVETGVRIAHSPEQYASIVRSDRSFQAGDFTAQQYIEGHGGGIFAASRDGQAIATFAHRRLREKPPSGGVSVLSESVVPEPRALDAAVTLLAALNWTGIAMVEFRIDPAGTPWLMEINPRPWGSIQLAVDAGIDFPRLAWCLANDREVEFSTAYRAGNRLRWLLGDLDHLLIRLKQDAGVGAKLRAVGRFLRPTRNCRHEVNRWDDLGPARYEAIQWLRDVFS